MPEASAALSNYESPPQFSFEKTEFRSSFEKLQLSYLPGRNLQLLPPYESDSTAKALPLSSK